MEKRMRPDTMQMAWIVAIVELYLHYDMKKDFCRSSRRMQ